MGRLEFERAIRRSSLPSPSRHIALTLATWADISTGVIPDQYQPSLSTLETSTGLSRKTVRTHLDTLESSGWLVRDRPDPSEAREGARTFYTMHIPPGAEARGARPLPVGADIPYPADEVGAEIPQGRGGDPLQVGAEIPRGRGRDPLKNPKSPKSLNSPAGTGPSGPVPSASADQRTGPERRPRRTSHGPGNGQMPLLLSVQGDGPTASVHHQLAEQMTDHYGTPVTVRHAAAVALVVLSGRAPHNPLAYVMAAVRRDPDRHRPTSLPPAYRAPLRRAAGDS